MRHEATKNTHQTAISLMVMVFLMAFAPNALRAEMIGSAEEIAEIKSFVESAEDAYVDRDWDRFADHFSEDALWMPNNRLPLLGESAWWSYAQRFWDTTEVVSMEVRSEDIIVLGDWAIERHSQVTEQTREDGEIRVSRSKGVWILHRADVGSWKIARYIWNRNPAPEE